MRFPTAYYLFILYTTLVFQPLLLIAEDTLSHVFANTIHIATVHAKYGNNHLQIELVTTSSNRDNNRDHNNDKSYEQVTVHVSSIECNDDFSLDNFHKSYFDFAWFKIPYVFTSLVTPPPKL